MTFFLYFSACVGVVTFGLVIWLLVVFAVQEYQLRRELRNRELFERRAAFWAHNRISSAYTSSDPPEKTSYYYQVARLFEPEMERER